MRGPHVRVRVGLCEVKGFSHRDLERKPVKGRVVRWSGRKVRSIVHVPLLGSLPDFDDDDAGEYT
jgi:hypothetical protein